MAEAIIGNDELQRELSEIRKTIVSFFPESVLLDCETYYVTHPSVCYDSPEGDYTAKLTFKKIQIGFKIDRYFLSPVNKKEFKEYVLNVAKRFGN